MIRHTVRQVSLLSASIALFGHCATSHSYDLVPLWETRTAQVTDTFYTTYFNDHQLSKNFDAGVEHGVAAWIACAVDTLRGPNGETPYMGQTVNGDASYQDYFTDNSTNPPRLVPSHGYQIVTMNFACAQPPNSAPLYRMYKGPPQTDHIYTTSVPEVASLEAAGYSFDRVEGYVFLNNLLGAPLKRYSLGANIPNHDVEHRYTISSAAGATLVAAGWTYEGIAGYVETSFNNPTINATGYTGTFNGASITPTTNVVASINNVVPSTSTYSIGASGAGLNGLAADRYGTFASNVTVRPAHAVWQNISFQFYTGDIFNTGSPLSHIPIFLHYASTATQNDLTAEAPYDGIAMVFAKRGYAVSNCTDSGAGGQVYLELGAGKAVAPGKVFSCDSNLTSPLLSNTWYQVSYSLGDSANVNLTISQIVGTTLTPLTFTQGTLPQKTTFSKQYTSYYSCPLTPSSPSANQTYCANPFSNDGYPVNNTGYMILPVQNPNTTADTTAEISHLTMHWLDANGNILN